MAVSALVNQVVAVSTVKVASGLYSAVWRSSWRLAEEVGKGPGAD